ncbi:hypothetical protein QTH91_05130 [Variovorax dokdonensis]|uniref:PXPV repeat-containing protein n=1 Tax=Variovorax dokdonensis TaxID=344883 RepID=A0ABT7N7D8_9BURK|nr:hypothetical protein [Variovorax dokdonensis]MDM0043859.1 hypothetical protein [Variovorax dokdonensis]
MTLFRSIKTVAIAWVSLAALSTQVGTAWAQQAAPAPSLPASNGADAPWRNVTPEPGIVVSGDSGSPAPAVGYPLPAPAYVTPPPVYVAPAPVYVAPAVYPRPWGWGWGGYGYGYAPPGISLNLGYTYHRR